MPLHDLRQIAECLREWQTGARESLDVPKRVTDAVQEPSPRLLNKSLIEIMVMRQNELQAQMNAMPPDISERLRLCSAGLAAVNSQADLAGEWSERPDENGAED